MNAQPVSPSAVYRMAAQLKPAGDEAVPADTHCILCAAVLQAGVMAGRPFGRKANETAKKVLGDSFNNKLDLRAMTGTHVCGDCLALWNSDWLGRYSKSFACSEGVFFLQRNEDVAAFLLKVPKPPFVAIFSTKKQAHMIWRTPVSYSQDVFFLRIDDEILTIRRERLMAAWEALRKVEKVMAEVKPAGKTRNLKPPAALFARELDSAKVGMLRPDVEALLMETGHQETIASLNSLSIGEWWALNFLRFVDPDHPPEWRNALTAQNEDTAEVVEAVED